MPIVDELPDLLDRDLVKIMTRIYDDEELDNFLNLNFDIGVVTNAAGEFYTADSIIRARDRADCSPAQEKKRGRGRPRNQAVGDLVPMWRAAELLDVSKPALTAWSKLGVGPKRHDVDGFIYYSETEINEFLAGRSKELGLPSRDAILKAHYTRAETAKLFRTSVNQLQKWTEIGRCPEVFILDDPLPDGRRYFYKKKSVDAWRKALKELKLLNRHGLSLVMTNKQFKQIVRKLG